MNTQELLKELESVLHDAKEKMLGLVEQHAEQCPQKHHELYEGLQEEIEERTDEMVHVMSDFLSDVEDMIDGEEEA